MLRKLRSFLGTVLAILFALWMERHMSTFDWFDWVVLGIAALFAATSVLAGVKERNERRIQETVKLRENALDAVQDLRHSLLRRHHHAMLWDEAQYRFGKLLDHLRAHSSPAAAQLLKRAPKLEKEGDSRNGSAWDVVIFLSNSPLWRSLLEEDD